MISPQHRTTSAACVRLEDRYTSKPGCGRSSDDHPLPNWRNFALKYECIAPIIVPLTAFGNRPTATIHRFLMSGQVDGALPGLPIFPHVSGGSIRERMSAEAPVEGQDFAKLLDFFAQVILPSSRHNGHPRFFGYVASPGTAATAIADLLASALNSNVTSWRSGPGPTELERQTIQWIKQIIGYPAEADGLFVSGGSMANFSALAAARDAKSPINLSTHGCQALDQPLRELVVQV